MTRSNRYSAVFKNVLKNFSKKMGMPFIIVLAGNLPSVVANSWVSVTRYILRFVFNSNLMETQALCSAARIKEIWWLPQGTKQRYV